MVGTGYEFFVLTVLVAMSVVWAIVVPFFRDSSEATVKASNDEGMLELLSEREALLRSLDDLEAERRSGAVTTEDFEQARARLLARALELIEEIERERNQRETGP